MIASAHVAAGAVAGLAGAHFSGKWIWRVVAAFAFGLVSHLLLDALPHSDYATLSRSTVMWLASLEAVGMTAVTGYMTRRLVPHWPWYVLVGVAGGALPDAKFFAPAVLPPELAGKVIAVTQEMHAPFHAPTPSSPALGLAVEVMVTVLCLAILLIVPRIARARQRAGARSEPRVVLAQNETVMPDEKIRSVLRSGAVPASFNDGRLS